MPSKSDLKRIARELESLTEEVKIASAENRFDENTRKLHSLRMNSPSEWSDLMKDAESETVPKLNAAFHSFGRKVQEIHPTTVFGKFETQYPALMVIRINPTEMVRDQYVFSSPRLRKSINTLIDNTDRYSVYQWGLDLKDEMRRSIHNPYFGHKFPKKFKELRTYLRNNQLNKLEERLDSIRDRNLNDLRDITIRYRGEYVPNPTGYGGAIRVSGYAHNIEQSEIELFVDYIDADTDDQLVRKFKALCGKNFKSLV